MMRLQRGSLRSDAATAGTGGVGDESVLDLILGLAVAVAEAGAVTGGVPSGLGAPLPGPAPTGGAASGWGALAGKVWESAAIPCVGVGGTTTCCLDVAG